MKELISIREHLRRTFQGGSWHGPALLELLNGISAEAARHRPYQHEHTIHELILHIISGIDFVAAKLRGEKLRFDEITDWPEAAPIDQPGWENLLRALSEKYQDLRRSIAALEESDLEKSAPGEPYNIKFMLHGLIHHNVYHAGQIASIRKSLQF